jgi:hypothetical protein
MANRWVRDFSVDSAPKTAQSQTEIATTSGSYLDGNQRLKPRSPVCRENTYHVEGHGTSAVKDQGAFQFEGMPPHHCNGALCIAQNSDLYQIVVVIMPASHAHLIVE